MLSSKQRLQIIQLRLGTGYLPTDLRDGKKGPIFLNTAHVYFTFISSSSTIQSPVKPKLLFAIYWEQSDSFFTKAQPF